jgi:RNA polymerase sigma-70 factor (ECF subfamily)
LLFDNQIPEELAAEIDTENPVKEEKINKLMQCIQQLKKDDRIIISLVLEDLSYKEIAEILGISRKGVEKRIYCALEKLRKDIQGI